MYRQDKERPAPGHLRHHRYKLGVGGAEVRVMGIARDGYVVVARIPLAVHAVHVSELGTAHPAKPELRKKREKESGWFKSGFTYVGTTRQSRT